MRRLDKPPEWTTEIIFKNSQEYFNMPCNATGSSNASASASDTNAGGAAIPVAQDVATEALHSDPAQLPTGSGASNHATIVQPAMDVTFAEAMRNFPRLSLHPLKKTMAGRKRKGKSLSAAQSVLAATGGTQHMRNRSQLGTAPPRRQSPGSSSLLPIDEEPDFVDEVVREKPARSLKSRLTHRSNPSDIVDTTGMLSLEQREEIMRLGWGSFLEFNLQALESRDLYCWLMDNIDPRCMVLRLPHGKVLPITDREVHLVLGVPLGTLNIPIHNSVQLKAATTKLRASLNISDRKISVARLQEEIMKHRVDDLSMQCFFLIVFNRLLFPTTSYDISCREIGLTIDLHKFSEINWCRAVVEDIQDAAFSWQTRDNTCKAPSITGCAPFIIIYYLDNLDHPLNKVDRLSTPRCNFFSKKKIEGITLADKVRLSGENSWYGMLQLMSQVGSCYQAPLPEGSAPAHPHVSCRPLASLEVPLLRDLLGDALDKITLRQRKDISRVVHALDTEVQGRLMDISHAHKSVVDAVYKHAADLRKIILAESTSSANVNRSTVDAGQQDDHQMDYTPSATPGLNVGTQMPWEDDTMQSLNPSTALETSATVDVTPASSLDQRAAEPNVGRNMQVQPTEANEHVTPPGHTSSSADLLQSPGAFEFSFFPPDSDFDLVDSTPQVAIDPQSKGSAVPVQELSHRSSSTEASPAPLPISCDDQQSAGNTVNDADHSVQDHGYQATDTTDDLVCALHRFAKQMLRIQQRRRSEEGKETYGGLSAIAGDSCWPFVEQLGRIYTRKIFEDLNKDIKKATAYRIADDPDKGENHYLVTHTNRTNKLSWGQHQFEVWVDEEREEFRCECRSWEHTGLFCVHLLRAFMHAQIEKIPAHYILRRYTRNARKDLPYDTHDMRRVVGDGKTELYRRTTLLTADKDPATGSRLTQENTTRMDNPPANRSASNSRVNDSSSRAPPCDNDISRVAPPWSKPKGRTMVEGEVRTVGAPGPKMCTRNCSICGDAKGHNSASCPQNPKNFDRYARLGEVRKRGRPKGGDGDKSNAKKTARRSLQEDMSERGDERAGDDIEIVDLLNE